MGPECTHVEEAVTLTVGPGGQHHRRRDHRPAHLGFLIIRDMESRLPKSWIKLQMHPGHGNLICRHQVNSHSRQKQAEESKEYE